MSDNPIVSKWNELKTLVESLEADVAKNAKGVAAAGVRARKGLRLLQSSAKELVKLTLNTDKSEKEAKSENTASVPETKPSKKKA